ncbi:MAG: helix-turn-helix domain-containing protein [Asticcacaulis sp.]|uniref:helix-turn-helix domain-containing protein n=1 Tax=Asticcacaulis sp. TaxID=1872648 RepID=UPI0039E23ED6
MGDGFFAQFLVLFKKKQNGRNMTERKLTFAGAGASPGIPRYYLYGDSEADGSWFVNVEPLSKRCRESNWHIAPHSHPGFTQIVLVKTGGGTMQADETTLPFGAHSVLVVPVHVVHGFSYDVDTDGWVLTIAESFRRKMIAEHIGIDTIFKSPRTLSLANSPRSFSLLNETLLELDQELDTGEVGAVVMAEAYVTRILITLLREIGAQQTAQSTLFGVHSTIVGQFTELLERRYREGWPVQRFADEMNITYSALRVACQNVIGEPPAKLVHDRIIAEAKRNLIYSNMSIGQIAYWLGFEDPSYFSRFFHKATGQRPLAFRQGQR